MSSRTGSMWARVAERAVPAGALSRMGTVPYRAADPSSAGRSGTVTVAGAGGLVEVRYTSVPVSRELLADAGIWVNTSGSWWHPWPNVTDMIGMALAAHEA